MEQPEVLSPLLLVMHQMSNGRAATAEKRQQLFRAFPSHSRTALGAAGEAVGDDLGSSVPFCLLVVMSLI